jgi:hypothetical protein
MSPRKPAGDPKVPEYRLLLAPHLAERTQQYVTRLILETTKTFATFRYELSVEESVGSDFIHLVVLGFKTPRLTLPSAGPARFQKDYDGLKGLFTVTVAGIDGRENKFSVRVAPEKVELVSPPRHSFVQIVTDNTRWTTLTA